MRWEWWSGVYYTPGRQSALCRCLSGRQCAGPYVNSHRCRWVCGKTSVQAHRWLCRFRVTQHIIQKKYNRTYRHTTPGASLLLCWLGFVRFMPYSVAHTRIIVRARMMCFTDAAVHMSALTNEGGHAMWGDVGRRWFMAERSHCS